MLSGCGHGAKILLKARPTTAQVADRLAPPVPEGLEFYLDAADITGDGWLERLVAIATAGPPDGFQFVVEGPLRSLDGAFFDATLPNEANLEVLNRLAAFGERIGARAAVIHAMAPRPSAEFFDRAARAEALGRALLLFRHYAAACARAGMIPTVENVPPVARMREGSFMYSLIGTPPADILYLAGQVPGLRATLDVSHAQLYINAFNARRGDVPAPLQAMVDFIQGQEGVASLDEYVDRVAGHLTESHISNAQGLLGEGLPYGEGDLDLDRVVRRLSALAAFLVTETLEPDADQATFMREAQRRMVAALGRDGRRRDDDEGSAARS